MTLYSKTPRGDGTEETEEEDLSVSNSYFPASKLFEYCWPLSDPEAECFMLQEHVSEFLELRAFQRKYPDIQRRTLDYEERKYLVEMGYVTETQSNLGLLAVKSDDVMAVMQEEFPAKYKEYTEHLNQKYLDVAVQQNSELSKQISLSQEEFLKDTDYKTAVRNAVQQVSEYNGKLLNNRWTNYYDGQTRIIHQPVRNPVDKGCKVKCRYPVALIPGQYQEMYRKYTTAELRCLPINTVLDKPQTQSASVIISSNSAHCTTATTTTTTTIATNSKATTATTTVASHKLDINQRLITTDATKKFNESDTPVRKRPGLPKTLSSIKRLRATLCHICYKTSNLKGLPEALLHCSKCANGVHPSCLQMSLKTAKAAKHYNWQCLECKTCSICEDPGEEVIGYVHCAPQVIIKDLHITSTT
ncbi:PHD finger protein 10-like isoform X2 [Dysidea avara]|uniref:PHD finger protein 10-like isoform X2 n=1 Tax=Dysidea avara TaxID=196820 RepID=UPI00333458A2